MADPMLNVKALEGESKKVTPHLLPCRIHHDGGVGPSKQFWEPQKADDGADGAHTAYFRGRKLVGRAVAVPEGYRGAVVEKKEPPERPARTEDEVVDVDAEDIDAPALGSLETVADFDKVIVWNHETAVDASEDPYVRGIEEWIKLSNKIHSSPSTSS